MAQIGSLTRLGPLDPQFTDTHCFPHCFLPHPCDVCAFYPLQSYAVHEAKLYFYLQLTGMVFKMLKMCIHSQLTTPNITQRLVHVFFY